MPVVRTFISHASDEKPRILPFLRKAAPYGVRPWIDQEELSAKAGSSLRASLMEALRDPSCRSLSLFLSEVSSKSRWVSEEVGEALAQVPDGFRVIPILLDPIASKALPPAFEAALRKHSGGIDTLYLDPAKPDFLAQWAASVLSAGGAADARDLVLHLGHRHPRADAEIPDPWVNLPAIDLRMNYAAGDRTFSPSPEEWQEIAVGLKFLSGRLKAQQIRICGMAHLGVAAGVGSTWDRGSGVSLEGWNAANRQVWTSAEAALTSAWTPEHGRHLKIEREGNYFTEKSSLTVVFARLEQYVVQARGWNARLSPAQPLLIVRTPERINTPADASEVLAECIGVFRWVRQTYPQFRSFDLIVTLPLPLVAFLAHHLRQMGTMRFHDQIIPECDERYRLALSWP